MSKSSTKSALAVRYSLGIDVSKSDLSVCFSQMSEQRHVSIKGSRKFGNTPTGWQQLEAWTQRLRKRVELEVSVVLEVTGVYHEGLAYYLRDKGWSVHVVLPNKSKHYARSLNVKTKNDEVDAQTLAQMGLERNLPLWRGMSANMQNIKHLCRCRLALQHNRTRVLNQLHAHTHSHAPHKVVTQSMHALLALLEQQIKALEEEIAKTCAQDPELQHKVNLVCSLPGVGLITALNVISEVNGFDLINNKNQLVSYAGYDVVEHQSGSSIRGKTRISKKGNSFIRAALHFPAMCAARHNPQLQLLYQRIVDKNPKAKMIAMVAVQRKLLVLIYSIFKNSQPFDPNYSQTSLVKQSRQDLSPAYTA